MNTSCRNGRAGQILQVEMSDVLIQKTRGDLRCGTQINLVASASCQRLVNPPMHSQTHANPSKPGEKR